MGPKSSLICSLISIGSISTRPVRQPDRGGILVAPSRPGPGDPLGFGPRTGARTLAEIGDPTRFANGSRLAAYAGISPADWRSGRTIDGASGVEANHRLKNALFLAAFVATQHEPDTRAQYERKRAEGKKHNAAVICVARRRCDLIHAMLTTATPIERRIRATADAAATACPSLAHKHVTTHTLRHTAAMRLLHAGVDTTVIALWLGHEQIATTNIYIHADMTIKENALAKTTPLSTSPTRRYQPDDTTLAFLASL